MKALRPFAKWLAGLMIVMAIVAVILIVANDNPAKPFWPPDTTATVILVLAAIVGAAIGAPLYDFLYYLHHPLPGAMQVHIALGLKAGMAFPPTALDLALQSMQIKYNPDEHDRIMKSVREYYAVQSPATPDFD
jgi:hypothetical protein